MINNNNRTNNKNTLSKLYLEKAGEKHIAHILKVIENAPWGVSLLQLAWTAGPVTFLALQGGYYLGYGRAATLEQFTYFAAYTLIAGLIGIIASVSFKVKQDARKERAQRDLVYVIDNLADLINSFCDFRLGLLNSDERKIEAAFILLKNSHLLPGSIEVAVFDITNDRKLAQTAKEIEVFRRAGLFTRSYDLAKTIESERAHIIQKLTYAHPQATHFLKLRLEGQAPTLKAGIPRAEGFLERIFSSAETGNMTWMSIRDAEELLILIFELINGRKIEVLNFSYYGNKRLSEASRKLENSQAAYRVSKSTMNYHIQKLITLLIENDLLISGHDEDFNTMYQKAYDCINLLAQDIIDNKKRIVDKNQLRKIKLLDKLISLHTLIFKAYKKVLKYRYEYDKAINDWHNITASYKDSKTVFRYGKGHRGLRVAEEFIALDAEANIDFIKELSVNLHDFLSKHPTREKYSETAIKQFAISLALAAEPFLHLSQPIIQNGINSANAVNLGSLEQGISAQAKTGWTAAMVKEVKKNLGVSAEKLARALVDRYDEELDAEAINFLHENYGARKEVLIAIQKNKDLQQFVSQDISDIKPNGYIWTQAKAI